MTTTPAAGSALLVTVSTCGTFQFAGVNRIDVGEIDTSASLLRSGIVTFARGAVFSTIVARFPDSTCVSRTVIPGGVHV